MIYSVRCESSIKGVLICSPILMGIVSMLVCNKEMEETILIMIISILLSIVILILILRTKYMMELDYLLIIRAWSKKKILYEEIDMVKKTEGKLSIETPSYEQIWLYKGDRVVAKLSPENRELFEKNITIQINRIRKS